MSEYTEECGLATISTIYCFLLGKKYFHWRDKIMILPDASSGVTFSLVIRHPLSRSANTKCTPSTGVPLSIGDFQEVPFIDIASCTLKPRDRRCQFRRSRPPDQSCANNKTPTIVYFVALMFACTSARNITRLLQLLMTETWYIIYMK